MDASGGVHFVDHGLCKMKQGRGYVVRAPAFVCGNERGGVDSGCGGWAPAAVRGFQRGWFQRGWTGNRGVVLASCVGGFYLVF